MAYQIRDPRHKDLFGGVLTEMYAEGGLAIVVAARRFYVVRVDLADRPAIAWFDARFVGLVTL